MHLLDEDDFEEEEKPGEPGWEGDYVQLKSVGIDIGTSTSHLVFSHLHMRRQSATLSSRFAIRARQILYESDILLTPYDGSSLIDVQGLAGFISEEYSRAGVRLGDIDIGAVILTGEAVKKENARAIGDMMARHGGQFVCVTAGPKLESVIAAYGSGAVALSTKNNWVVLNMDVGGGTTKFSVVDRGKVVDVFSAEIGGRLLAYDEQRRLIRIEDAGERLAKAAGISVTIGMMLAENDADAIAALEADCLAELLHMVVKGDGPSGLTKSLLIDPPAPVYPQPIDAIVVSGGVSEYVDGLQQETFGDLGANLGTELRERITGMDLSRVSAVEGIRATVIGASQFTVQLSGSTIFISNPGLLPLRNIQACRPSRNWDKGCEMEDIRNEVEQALSYYEIPVDQPVGLVFRWEGEPAYVGRLGAELDVSQGQAAARLAMVNCIAQLKSHLGSLDRVRRIVKVLGFVACTDDFDQQPFVVNGGSELLEQVFGVIGRHARSAVGTNMLPFGIPVEIELIAEVE